MTAIDENDLESFDGVECIGSTGLALHCKIPRSGTLRTYVWIPQSVIADDSEVYDAGEHARGTLVIAGWFARKEGLA